MATLVLGAVGAGIGSMIGGTFLGMSATALGWNIGSLLGGYLFAPKQPTQYGPRLGDLKVQTSTYGNPIPVLFGSTRVAGNMIWSAPIAETAHSQTSGGKGGGGGVTQVSFTYSQSFAIAICDCEITGIRKIWANGTLIYNLSDTASIETIIASNQAAAGIRIYTGSETQTADSLIQAYVGAADTPAYRGTAYVVFEGLQLADYGNRTPNLEFEVVKVGTASSTASNVPISPPVGWPINQWACIAKKGNTFAAPAISNIKCAVSVNGGSSWFTTDMPFSGDWENIASNNRIFLALARNSGNIAISNDGITWISQSAVLPGLDWRGLASDSNNSFCTIAFQSKRVFITSTNGSFWVEGTLPDTGTNYWNDIASNGSLFCAIEQNSTNSAISSDGINWTLTTLPISANWQQIIWTGTTFAALASGYLALSTDGITWTYSVIAPAGIPTVGLSWRFAWDGKKYCVILPSPYLSPTINKYCISADGVNWTLYTGSQAQSSVVSIAAGTGYFVVPTFGADIVELIYATLSKTNISLDSIVYDICLRAGLTAGQIDVTALTDTVDGYVVQRGTARSWLEQLMQAYFFDAVESDGKIKFVKRGGAAMAAIPEADLAAHEYGSTPPDTLIINRQQEMELPVEVEIQYMDIAAAYQIGSQASRRLMTESYNQQSINLAISMSATKAKQISDVLMYDGWTTRTAFDFSTSWKYSHLEPTDVVSITKGGRTYNARIVDEDAGAGIMRRTAVLEDAGIYTQSAAAAPISVPDDTVSTAPLTDLVLMDIPLLRDQDDGVGFYGAACGYGNGWYGAQTFKSNDGGVTWNSFGRAFLNEATIGAASGVLGNFYSGNIFDELNSVTVVLINGTLASDTELNILNGANVALLGDEIIQFKNAVLTASNTYLLTGLLRGRRGTEFGMSTHVSGERFVLLTETTTYLFDGSSTEYDLLRQYRGVSFGGFLDDAATVNFTNTAAALMPYSAVHLGGGRNAALDVVLTWTRRTRIGGAWNNYADVPLGETSEAYEVEIWNAGYTVLKRTITGIVSATTTYTAAMQVADFGSAQATVYFSVYQISAVVGRGFEARGSV